MFGVSWKRVGEREIGSPGFGGELSAIRYFTPRPGATSTINTGGTRRKKYKMMYMQEAGRKSVKRTLWSRPQQTLDPPLFRSNAYYLFADFISSAHLVSDEPITKKYFYMFTLLQVCHIIRTYLPRNRSLIFSYRVWNFTSKYYKTIKKLHSQIWISYCVSQSILSLVVIFWCCIQLKILATTLTVNEQSEEVERRRTSINSGQDLRWTFHVPLPLGPN